jgi:hypothetical protein
LIFAPLFPHMHADVARGQPRQCPRVGRNSNAAGCSRRIRRLPLLIAPGSRAMWPGSFG